MTGALELPYPGTVRRYGHDHVCVNFGLEMMSAGGSLSVLIATERGALQERRPQFGAELRSIAERCWDLTQ